MTLLSRQGLCIFPFKRELQKVFILRGDCSVCRNSTQAQTPKVQLRIARDYLNRSLPWRIVLDHLNRSIPWLRLQTQTHTMRHSSTKLNKNIMSAHRTHLQSLWVLQVIEGLLGATWLVSKMSVGNSIRWWREMSGSTIQLWHWTMAASVFKPKGPWLLL